MMRTICLSDRTICALCVVFCAFSLIICLAVYATHGAEYQDLRAKEVREYNYSRTNFNNIMVLDRRVQRLEGAVFSAPTDTTGE